ncbi:MAG: hypothetical protein LBS74_10360 [Oscillospiraceae bacterium]|jgi:hypothetical protein|nr:hypothetical protein [Oscillospiraceae bacterium]
MSKKKEIEAQGSSAFDANEKKDLISAFKTLFKPSLYPLVMFLILTLAVGTFTLGLWFDGADVSISFKLIVTGVFLLLAALSCWWIIRYRKALREYKTELNIYIDELNSLTEEDLNRELTPEEQLQVDEVKKSLKITFWVEVGGAVISVLLLVLKVLEILLGY